MSVHQYHFVNAALTWADARTYCREKYADLATVGNTTEMNELINTVSSAGYGKSYWSDDSSYSFRYWDDLAKLFGSSKMICGFRFAEIIKMEVTVRWNKITICLSQNTSRSYSSHGAKE